MAELIRFIDLHPPIANFELEIIEGLRRQKKTLSPKFFYDAEGSRLFKLICDLPEYYPTRTECAILRNEALTIRNLLPIDATVIEFGSGSSDKINLLATALDTMRRYVPIDISRDFLLQNAEAFALEHPEVEVTAICADFTEVINLSSILDNAPRIGFFPGSTIGNFSVDEAKRFLRDAANTLGPGGHLIIGVDLRKDRARLISAYDDKDGVTAAFNLNLLFRINNELDGDFVPSQFQHLIRYNDLSECIEMHLQSTQDQQVRVAGHVFEFGAGETIHTESSHKYTLEGFRKIAQETGFTSLETLTDVSNLFSVHVLKVESF